MPRTLLALGVLLLILPACTSDGGEGGTDADSTAAAPDTSATPGFAPRLEVDLEASTQLPSGLYYRDLTVGTGPEAGEGSRVAVLYGGWLPDGTFFDGSANHGNRPYPFTIGEHEVVAGWEEGITGMRVGGRRQLIIPPELGYGAVGSPPIIPPNSILVFTVDLLGIESPDMVPVVPSPPPITP